MSNALKVSGAVLNGTPVLLCPMGNDPSQLKRISSATFDTHNGVCYMPAYPPFLTPMLSDLQVLFGKVEYSDKAKEIIASGRQLESDYAQRKMPAGFTFKTKPYEHQKESRNNKARRGSCFQSSYPGNPYDFQGMRYSHSSENSKT